MQSPESTRRKGVYRLQCKRCDRSFIWKGFPEDKAPVYHSDRCRKNDQRVRKNSNILPCPRPEKRVFSSVEQAQYFANRMPDIQTDAGFYAYRCICSAIHIGHRTRRFIRWSED